MRARSLGGASRVLEGRRARWLAAVPVIGLIAGVAVAVSATNATAVQATGDDLVAWANGWSWTYATTFNYDDGNGTNANINENVTFTNSGPTTFAGQPAYQLNLSGTITGGSGGTDVSGIGHVTLSSFSGSVSGTEYVRRSDLALLQQQQHQQLHATAKYSIISTGVDATIDLTMTPNPGWKALSFPLNNGDNWTDNTDVAYSGGFSYTSSFANGSSPFNGDFPFVAHATDATQTISEPIGSVATHAVSATTADGSTTDNQWYAPSYRNLAKEHMVLPLDGASLVIDRNLSGASVPTPSPALSAGITPSLTCAGGTVTIAGALSSGQVGVPVAISLDKSAASVGAAVNASATTGTNGVYSATLTAPADSDGLGKNGARATWGVLVTAGSANAVATVVVTPQDCSTITYTGATSAAQLGTATVSAQVTDLANAANAAGQTVTFTLAGGGSTTAVTNSSGVATASLAVNGPPRATSIAASIPATAGITAASTSTAFTVTKDPTSTAVVSSAPSVTIGDPVHFTATVTPGLGSGPTGTVQFFIDGANFGTPVALVGGTATSDDISTLALGTHNVQAVYGGDANFASSPSAIITVKVHNPLLPTTTTTTVDVNPSVAGQAVTFTSTVAPKTGTGTPTGSVTFTDNGNPIGTSDLQSTPDGLQATFTTGDLSVGTHQIVGTYNADDVYAASASPVVNQVVNKGATTAAVHVDNSSTVTGQVVNVTATVSAQSPAAGTPSGLAHLVVDGTTLDTESLSGGSAAFAPVDGLTAGSHTIAVTYDGDASFSGSTGSAAQSVGKATTVTSLVATPNPSSESQAVSITASVSAVAPGSGTPTGTVSFTSNGDPIGAATLDANGKAVLVLDTLPVGDLTLAASYGGDGNYVASSADGIDHTVRAGSAQDPTTTTLTSSQNPSSYGDLITFTALVTTASETVPTGAVQFSLDGAAFGNPVPLDATGHATSVSLASPDPGDHLVIAAFIPDAGFASSGDFLTQTVSDATVTATLTSSNPSSANGQAVSFTATVHADRTGVGAPTGAVQFAVDGTALGNPVTLNASGVAQSISIATLHPGSHTVTALYSGDVHFESALKTLTQSVGKVATTTTLTASRTSSTYGDGITFTATVHPAATNLGAPDGSVTFTDGTNTIATVPVSASGTNGTATLTIANLDGGSHSIKAAYTGSASFTGSTSGSIAVTVARRATLMKADAAIMKLAPPPYVTRGQLRVTLSSALGPLAGVPITFTIGAATICTSTTGADGVATCDAANYGLQLTLAGGYNAKFAGNADFLAVTAHGAVIN